MGRRGSERRHQVIQLLLLGRLFFSPFFKWNKFQMFTISSSVRVTQQERGPGRVLCFSLLFFFGGGELRVRVRERERIEEDQGRIFNFFKVHCVLGLVVGAEGPLVIYQETWSRWG